MVARNFQRPFSLPAGATEVVLIRHGSVLHVPPELAQAPSDPSLNALGIAQADAVAARLADMVVTAVFVTPLRRTLQTIAPFAAARGLDPGVLEDLREVHLGDWEGQLNQRVADGDPLVAELFAAERWDVVPGAESGEDFAARVARGLDAVADAAGPDGTGVIVAHGGVIAEACRQVTGSRGFAFLNAENGSLTRVMRLPRSGWALISFNDTAHLAAVAA